MIFVERFFIKYDKNSNSGGYRHVSDIKDRVEKLEVFAAPDWKPLWEIPFEDREVEHVDHFSVEYCPVRFFRKQRGQVVMAVVENNAVENRINDVSEGARQNQCDGDNKVIGAVFPDRIPKPISYRCDRYESEKCQE